MKTTVREAIADIIRLEGVDYVFGHTGGHIMLLWDAIDKAGIKTVFNKQEGNATYMADGYSKLSGKPVVVLGTSGPGIQNTVTGIASAYVDSVPIIAIGAGVSTTVGGMNALQESSGRGRATSQLDIFKGITKQAVVAPSPAAVPRIIRESFRTALGGRPGPVFVEIPSDFWNVEIDYEQVDPSSYKNPNTPSCDSNDIDEIFKAFYEAEKPVILIGEGAIEKDISPKLMNFLNTVKVPFYVSPKGKDLVDEYDEYFVGALRWHRGMPREYGYIKESDFILSLGDRFGQWEFDWDYENIFTNARIAQVDPDYNEIGRVYSVDYSAVGCISSFMNGYGDKLNEHKNSAAFKEEAKKYNYKLIRPRRYPDRDGINPLNVNNITEELMPKEAVVVADTAFAGSMAINKFRTNMNQRFVVSDNNSPMGYSLPAAIGAAFYTDLPVVCFIGDGSFQMTFNEFGTILNYKKKVIYVLENNGGCMSINMYLNGIVGGSNPKITKFDNPDFAEIAKSYGMKGVTVKTSEEFGKAFKEALEIDKSTVINAIINQELMEWE